MSVYFDLTHDEWVGDHATYDGEFISRQTEWFATKEQAEHFSRTGERHTFAETVAARNERINREFEEFYGRHDIPDEDIVS